MNPKVFAQIAGSFIVVLVILIIGVIALGFLFGPGMALLGANIAIIAAGTYLALAINNHMTKCDSVNIFA